MRPRHVAGVAVLVLGGLPVILGGPTAGSATPTGVCQVCGITFHPNVTATTATLRMTAGGDVRWHVENKMADPTAAEWRQNVAVARGVVADRLDDRWRHPHDPTGVTVDMDGDTLVVEFVDRGAARQRFGLLLLPHLHGEGVETRYVINADRFVVVAPEGQRIVNEPTDATVSGDRVTWTGIADGDGGRASETWIAPEPGDTYVVRGSGVSAGVREPVVVTLEPLEPYMYGIYGLGALLVLGLPLGIAAGRSHRLGTRELVARLALVVAPYVLLVAAMHLLQPPGTLPGFAGLLMLAGGTVVVTLVGGSAMWAWTSRQDPGGDSAG